MHTCIDPVASHSCFMHFTSYKKGEILSFTSYKKGEILSFTSYKKGKY